MTDSPNDHEKNLIEFNRIDDFIFIGTNMCCQTHFDEKLLDAGITADISLEKEHVDAPYGVHSYLWLPTTDHEAPTQEQLSLGVSHIQALLAQGRKIYIHCKNGHGRGPTLAAAFYLSTGMPVDEAIAFILAKREGSHLEDVQIEALREFGKLF